MFQMKILFVLLPLLAQVCLCKSFGESDEERLKSLFSKDKLEGLRQALGKAMDPYVFPKDVSFSIRHKSKLNLNMTIFKGTQIRGLSNVDFDDPAIRGFFNTVELRASVPSIQMEGGHKLQGLYQDSYGREPINSRGQMFIRAESPRVEMELKMDRTRGGSSMGVKQVQINDMSIGGVSMELEGMKRGMMSMLNDYLSGGKAEEMFDEKIKPLVLPKLENILKTIINKYLKQIQ